MLSCIISPQNCKVNRRAHRREYLLKNTKEARVGGVAVAAAAAAAEKEEEKEEGLFAEDGRRRCKMRIRP